MNIIETNLSFGTMSKRASTYRIILHHAAMNGSVEDIHRVHKNKGWAGIGYHFYVRKDGSVYRGRPEWAIGAHASGSNYNSLGICAEGNFEHESMSDVQKNARRILVDWDKYYKNTSITQVALVDLTYLTLNEWAHNLIKKYSLTKKQYYNMSIIMRQCLDYACEPELNLLKDNPFRRVRIKSNLFTRKEKPKSNTQVFIVNEQQKICETAKKKIAEHPWCTTPLMILLNFQLGLRISEICAIKWSDIEDNYIHIQRMEVEDYTIKEIDGELKSISNGYTIVPYTKSVAGDRKVYLNDSAKKILRQIKKTNMEYGYYDQDFIFIKSQGCVRGTTSAFSQYLTDLCVEAGVMKKSSHKIRKTYISSLFDQKININTIREQAGHEDEQTSLNNYCFDQNTDRVIEDKLEHAANKNVCI